MYHIRYTHIIISKSYTNVEEKYFIWHDVTCIMNFDTLGTLLLALNQKLYVAFVKHFGKLPHFQDGTSWHIFNKCGNVLVST